MDNLTIALESVDLPSLVLELYPESRAIPSKPCKCLAVWRGEKNESVSLFLRDGIGIWLFKDHATGQCGNAFFFLVEIVGLSKQLAAEKIISLAGLEDKSQNPSGNSNKPFKKEIVATYEYVDEEGKFLFETVRFEPKSFAQRIREGGQSVWKLGNTRRVLFNLPEVLRAIAEGKWVFLVEGEKDVLTLKRYGFVATTCPMGAVKWLAEYTKSLTGAKLIISPDNDVIGLEHSQKVAQEVHEVTAELKIIELTGLKEKEDITDWFNDGNTASELDQIVENTKPFDISEVQKTDEVVISKPREVAKNGKETPAELTLRLFEQEDVELFYSPDEKSYASLNFNSHTETYHLSATGLKRFLTKIYWQKAKKALGNQSLIDIIGVLDAQAQFDGEKKSVFHRIEGTVHICP